MYTGAQKENMLEVLSKFSSIKRELIKHPQARNHYVVKSHLCTTQSSQAIKREKISWLQLRTKLLYYHVKLRRPSTERTDTPHTEHYSTTLFRQHFYS